jgi:hypothetical protein
MIKSKSEMPVRPIEIDLTGPDGNAFALMAYAKKIGRLLGYSESKVDAIITVMQLSDYEGLLHTFEDQFGDYVVMWR